jgi:hypothetical protein
MLRLPVFLNPWLWEWSGTSWTTQKRTIVLFHYKDPLHPN